MRKGFSVKEETEYIIEWIRDYFRLNNGKKAIIGISGGKDSTIIAKLCSVALGTKNVYGVLMPNGVQSDIEDSLKVVNEFDIDFTTINIIDSYISLLDQLENCSLSSLINDVTTTNIPPRLRMTALYSVASMFEGGRVVCTGNASEEYIGYSTKWGDGCGDFAPLWNYTVSEVIEIGSYLGISKDLIYKTPADGLSGLSDEDNLGFTYDQLESYMIRCTCGDTVIDEKIKNKHLYNIHKSEGINIPCPHPRFIKQRY